MPVRGAGHAPRSSDAHGAGRSWCPRRATSPTCSPTCAGRAATWRSSWTSTAARPASSPSRTSSRRSSARSTTSTTAHAPRLTRVQRPGSGCSPARCTPTRCSTPAGFDVPEGDYETLAGFVLDRLGRIPEVGRAASSTTAGGSRWSRWTAAAWPRCGSPRRARGTRVTVTGSYLVALGGAAAGQRVLRGGRVRARSPAGARSSRRWRSRAAPRARLALGSMRHLNVQLAGAQLGITMASLLLGFVAEPAVADLIEDAVGRSSTCPTGCCTRIGFVVGAHDRRVPPHGDRRDGAEEPRHRRARADAPRARPAEPGLRHSCSGRSSACSTRSRTPGCGCSGIEPRDELATAASADELAVDARRVARRGAHRGGRAPAAHRRARPRRSPHHHGDGAPRRAWCGCRARPRRPRPRPWWWRPGTPGCWSPASEVDDVLGFVHAKDLLTVSGAARQPAAAAGPGPPDARARAPRLARRRACWPCSAPASTLRWWPTTSGRTLGIATLEDVIEALVGDIRDESDR